MVPLAICAPIERPLHLCLNPVKFLNRKSRVKNVRAASSLGMLSLSTPRHTAFHVFRKLHRCVDRWHSQLISAPSSWIRLIGSGETRRASGEEGGNLFPWTFCYSNGRKWTPRYIVIYGANNKILQTFSLKFKIKRIVYP